MHAILAAFTAVTLSLSPMTGIASSPTPIDEQQPMPVNLHCIILSLCIPLPHKG